MKEKYKMSDADFKSEHKRLINTLTHPTKAKLLKEKKLQEDELEEFFAKR